MTTLVLTTRLCPGIALCIYIKQVVTWETAGPFTGEGDYIFTGSGDPFRMAVDVSAVGTANQLDPTAPARYARLGWFTFIDQVNGSSYYYQYHPVFWIEFLATQYIAPATQPWYVYGLGGIHYRLYPGVEASWIFEMP